MKNRTLFALAMALAAMFCPTETWAKKAVLTGIDVLTQQHFKCLQGKRVGLITNPTGVNANLVSTVDVLKAATGVNLVALYGPEHGVRCKDGTARVFALRQDPKANTRDAKRR